MAESNRQIGGVAPSVYSKRIIRYAPIDETKLRRRVESHLVNFDFFMADDFDRYFIARAKSLLKIIEKAMGRSITDRGSDETVKIYGETLEDQPEEK